MENKKEFTSRDVFEWFKDQRFQRQQGEQEYTMIYEIDLPKIINKFISDKYASLQSVDKDKRIAELEEALINSKYALIDLYSNEYVRNYGSNERLCAEFLKRQPSLKRIEKVLSPSLTEKKP